MKQYGSDPATFHYQVTPANTPLTVLPRFLYFNTSGNCVITDSTNTSITYIVTAGQTLNMRPYIIATGTSANTVAMY